MSRESNITCEPNHKKLNKPVEIQPAERQVNNQPKDKSLGIQQAQRQDTQGYTTSPETKPLGYTTTPGTSHSKYITTP